MSVTRWASSVGSAAYTPCALPIAGAKQSTPVARMKAERHLERLARRLLVGADVVLDPLDALDLALDVGAVAARLGHDLVGLALVLLDRQRRGVEQHGVPAALQARVMTSRSGQWSRCRVTGTSMPAGHRPPHAEEHVRGRSTSPS